MTAILRAALLTTFVAVSIPPTAAGQDTSAASLLRRIELLERANTDLEQRVRELESLVKSVPSQSQPILASTKWQDLANWRRLQLGMRMDKVQALLGPPERVVAGSLTVWFWADANVQFRDGKLDGWSEPRR